MFGGVDCGGGYEWNGGVSVAFYHPFILLTALSFRKVGGVIDPPPTRFRFLHSLSDTAHPVVAGAGEPGADGAVRGGGVPAQDAQYEQFVRERD